jgi:PAS domain S-box-containing protein
MGKNPRSNQMFDSGGFIVSDSTHPAPKAKHKRIQEPYEHIPIGIVETAIAGKFISVNEEFCRLLGYERQELLQLGIQDVIYQEDYSVETQLLEQLLAGNIPFYKLEKRFVRKDGQILWVELTRSLVRNTRKKAPHTVEVVLDITERQRTEDALRASEERLHLAIEAARLCVWELNLQIRHIR